MNVERKKEDGAEYKGISRSDFVLTRGIIYARNGSRSPFEEVKTTRCDRVRERKIEYMTTHGIQIEEVNEAAIHE